MQSAERDSRLARTLLVLLSVLTLALGGCGGAPKQLETGATTTSGPPDAVPRVEPKARYGNMKSYVVFGKTYYPKKSSRGHVERGIASWYGPKFHGRKTSSGEPYDMHQMTAAHKTLPLPTYAVVKNLENGRSAIVKVNDRGPFVGDRIIDLSYAAAKKLGVDKKGLARVEVVSIDPRDHNGKVPKRHRVAAESQQRYRPQRKPLVSSRGLAKAPSKGSSRSAANPSSIPTATAAAPKPEPQPTARHPSLPTSAPIPRSSLAGVAAVASDTDSPLYVQIGAFGTRDNAEQLRQRLTGLLQNPIEVREAGHSSASGTPNLYKVQVGPVASRSDADHLSRKLTSLGIARPLLVMN
ncbi:MAG: septal ring lytic transglycosylase RlpA family protein [Thiohalocapsa sp.]